ncbi:hypothetical protein [Streptomyces bambusae]|uniref:Uncharacterized protein n=1 Tax=Streptomyces bambusae TaxID=1550616 RepID=A0ABS6YYM3_9ACTN|nr:hypothetical protein [Streptomyces bambusae]MBW5480583.1 hypothetical protein [Streptomyces bambusae]
MDPVGEGLQQLDAVSVDNAKTTLVQLLARAGVYAGDAEELIELVEAGALAAAHAAIRGSGVGAPAEQGGLYASGWLDGARAVSDELGGIAERALQDALGADRSEGSLDPRSPVGRMELERVKVAVLPLYLSFTTVSDLDPEVSEQVLRTVLRTMSPRQRAGYPGRLSQFASAHRARLERLYAEYGPGSAIAIHGRYGLLHSPTSIAVLERIITSSPALRDEWDAAELPPAWLDGLETAWGSPA